MFIKFIFVSNLFHCKFVKCFSFVSFFRILSITFVIYLGFYSYPPLLWFHYWIYHDFHWKYFFHWDCLKIFKICLKNDFIEFTDFWSKLTCLPYHQEENQNENHEDPLLSYFIPLSKLLSLTSVKLFIQNFIFSIKINLSFFY